MSTRVVGPAVAVVAALVATGCGAQGSSSASQPLSHGRVSHNVTTGSGLAGTAGVVRRGCGQLAAGRATNESRLASLPAATAVAHSGLLTRTARAIMGAGLTSILNSATAITIFAPDDDAFAALGRGNLATLLASRPDLTKVLKYHIVSGRHTPADLASGKHLTTLLGTVIIPAKSHGKYRVNNAQVVCGEIRAANATIYIVNKFLVPIP
jgi:uncharacterized surface protein with fasciclin (FAS1) repeats